jgi:hypothetical protein
LRWRGLTGLTFFDLSVAPPVEQPFSPEKPFCCGHKDPKFSWWFANILKLNKTLLCAHTVMFGMT